MSGEREPIVANNYEQSVAQLFALLDSEQPNPNMPRYFAATWSADNPGEITQLATMSARPSGALRHMRYGQFYQAQLWITETVDNETTSRFVWCKTKPLEPNKPIQLDIEALAEDYGYVPLTSDDITNTLVGQAQTTQDYITLIATLKELAIEPTQELADAIDGQVLSFIHKDYRRGRDYPAEFTQERDQIFRLIQVFLTSDFNLSRATRGHLLGHLLRTISFGKVMKTPEAIESAKQAAYFLNESINSDIISIDEQHIRDRVFTTTPIYVFPFATKLLYAKLKQNPRLGTPHNIFGVSRTLFAGYYIATVLGALHPKHAEYIDQLAASNRAQTHPADSSPHLLDLVKNLVALVPDSQSDASKIAVNNIANVPSAFGRLLTALRSDESEPAPSQRAFNKMAVQIVRWVLAKPPRSTGKQAL